MGRQERLSSAIYRIALAQSLPATARLTSFQLRVAIGSPEFNMYAMGQTPDSNCA
jgi:hypothetical protein